MIITDVKLHNICGFRNFEANFTYPKKIVNSSIANEHLDGVKNFRYRKINVLAGANASGKTSFGRALNAVFIYLGLRDPNRLISLVSNMKADAIASVELVTEENIFYSVNIRIKASKKLLNEKVLTCIRSYEIKETDNYTKCCEAIEKQKVDFKVFNPDDLEIFSTIGWNFTFTDDNSTFSSVLGNSNQAKLFEITKGLLKTLDPSISAVDPIDDKRKANAFLIRFHDTDKVVISNDGDISDPNKLLSRGTGDALKIASLVYSVLDHKQGFYYCDEQFSFIQSDFEQAILSLLADNISNHEQLFFTTHNLDLLEMDFPLHSYSFFRKDTAVKEEPIQLIHADDYIKKNTTSLRNAVENDLFRTEPDTSPIFELQRLAEEA